MDLQIAFAEEKWAAKELVELEEELRLRAEAVERKREQSSRRDFRVVEAMAGKEIGKLKQA